MSEKEKAVTKKAANKTVIKAVKKTIKPSPVKMVAQVVKAPLMIEGHKIVSERKEGNYYVVINDIGTTYKLPKSEFEAL